MERPLVKQVESECRLTELLVRQNKISKREERRARESERRREGREQADRKNKRDERIGIR